MEVRVGRTLVGELAIGFCEPADRVEALAGFLPWLVFPADMEDAPLVACSHLVNEVDPLRRIEADRSHSLGDVADDHLVLRAIRTQTA